MPNLKNSCRGVILLFFCSFSYFIVSSSTYLFCFKAGIQGKEGWGKPFSLCMFSQKKNLPKVFFKKVRKWIWFWAYYEHRAISLDWNKMDWKKPVFPLLYSICLKYGLQWMLDTSSSYQKLYFDRNYFPNAAWHRRHSAGQCIKKLCFWLIFCSL